MEALYLSAGRLSYHADYPEPAAGAGETVVAVELAGICGTDLELLHGYAGFEGIPGHEMVGRVVESSGEPRWLGRRVVVDINVGCGMCPRCAAGNRKHCPDRRVIGIRDRPGGFAGRLGAPLENLVAVPDSLDSAAAVFAEPLAAALAVVPLLGADPGPVLVVGAGRLGQLILRALAAASIPAHALCRHDSQRRLARAAGAESVVEAQLEPDSRDAVVEASGSGEGLALALEVAAPGATVVVKSTCAEPVTLDVSRMVVKEVRLAGSRCGSLPDAVRALDEGAVDVDGLVEAVLPLSRAAEAFERAARPGARKVLFQPGAAG